MEQTAVDKALQVLFHVHGQPGPLGVSEVGRALSLPRSSAHRLLSVLKRHDLVEQLDDGRYRAGMGALVLASGLLGRDPLIAAAHPVLARTAAQLAETCFLVAARAGVLRVLDKAEGSGVLRASPTLGSQVPVHATAAGKLYLAHAPEELQARGQRLPADGAPERFTPHTVRDAAALQAEVQLAKQRGHAHNDQEWIEGLSVVAAPVFAGERLACAICVALPSARFSQLNKVTIEARVRQAADEVATRLEGIHHESLDRR